MKIKNYLTLTLMAAVSFAACDKGENGADGDKAALYLATKGFSPAVTSDVAKIYQVKFEFDDGDLANPQKCVEVSVDVVAWDVVPVIAQL